MTEQMPAENNAANDRELLDLKRTKQTCITLFVVFVIVLLAFGKAPFVKTTGTDGSRLDFNVFSCLGVAMGVFALIFLLTGVRRILRLGTSMKVLGLVGCLGLILHAVIAIFLPLTYGVESPPAVGTPAVGTPSNGAKPTKAVGTAGHHPLAQSGSEAWVIDGKAYPIASTYYLRLPQGFQFTIEYPYQFGETLGNMNDARALEIVFPLMEHAYRNDLYKRMSVTKVGEGKLTPSRIGVVLFEKQGGRTRGYRVALNLEQIKKRMEEKKNPTTQSANLREPWQDNMAVFIEVLGKLYNENVETRPDGQRIVELPGISKQLVGKTVRWAGELKYVRDGNPYFKNAFVKVSADESAGVVEFLSSRNGRAAWTKIKPGTTVTFTGKIGRLNAGMILPDGGILGSAVVYEAEPVASP